MGRWGKRLGAVTSAYVEVLVVEMETLQDDLGRSSTALLRASLWIGSALAVLFWAVAMITYLLLRLLTDVAGLSQLLAATVLTLLLLAVGIGLGYLGLRCLRSMETVPDVIRRHLSGHLKWVRSDLLQTPPPRNQTQGEAAVDDQRVEEENEEILTAEAARQAAGTRAPEPGGTTSVGATPGE